jgi:hypothetical protein
MTEVSPRPASYCEVRTDKTQSEHKESAFGLIATREPLQ